MKMILEVEKKEPVVVEKFSSVEKALNSLKSYGPSSYASLTKEDGSYLQVAGGRVTCVLEYRVPSDQKHLRAYLATPKVSYEGTQTLMFGGGHMNMEPDEMLFIDDVIAAFKAFFNAESLPENLLWRDMPGMFDN